MKVFVNCVDTAFGHNVSRLISQTAIGSRRESEEEQEPDEQHNAESTDASAPKPKTKEYYSIIGTLVPQPKMIEDGKVVERLYLPPTMPGPIIETGDKKKDAARREAIEKFAVMGQKPLWVSDLVDSDNKEALRQALMRSDVIIYDLMQSLDDAVWAIEYLSQQSETYLNSPKAFIAVSTIMTWAKTKIDQDDPDAFLTEEDYRRRKPHPNFKAHVPAEKEIIKHGKKSSLKTYIISSALVYHSQESIFHHFLKAAWHNENEIICYGEGANVIPTIHLDDLCNIVTEVVETTPETKYLLAVDDSKNTLYDICKVISESLGNGKVRKVSKETAFLNKNISQNDYDMLLVNLKLEPGHVKDMSFEWKSEAGLIENISLLIQEYKDARGLSPLKIFIHGPPACGKSYFAQKIAEFYEIHLIEVQKVVHQAITRLERRVAGSLDPDEADDDTEADKEFLEEVKDAAAKNNGKYSDEHIIHFVKEKLKSMPCRNQGYVLDGFPTTTEEARELFKSSNEDEQERNGIDELTIPEFVIALESSDEFIKERIMNLPESIIAGTKNSEEALLRRLEEYRAQNTEENTILNFFDEVEIHPLVISVENVPDETVMQTITQSVGKPHNYGPTPEQIAEKRRIAEDLKNQEALAAEEEKLRREKEEAERKAKAIAEWNIRLEEVRKQEQEVLEAQSVPLRSYLMKYIMPTLTSGLIEVCKVRPEDPIDHLAEFLFRHNPANMTDVEKRS